MQSNHASNDIYQQVTNSLIERIESGKLSCWQPWKSVTEPDGTRINRPVNFVTRRPYTGINAFLLGSTPYRMPYFLTFNQVKELGAAVNKGARSLPVIFWELREREEAEKKIPFLRHYRVFNVEDTTVPVEVQLTPQPAPIPATIRIPDADAVVSGMTNAPRIEHVAGKGCFYQGFTDTVSMEPFPGFESPEFYYGVLLHELIHSTAHPQRLNRWVKGSTPRTFGSKEYGIEELTAELGAAYLCQQVGIANERVTQNQAGYLQNWLNALKNDKRLFFDAARQAQKAVDYINGQVHCKAEAEVPTAAAA